jgi:polyhydroxybutyrate depolymerase
MTTPSSVLTALLIAVCWTSSADAQNLDFNHDGLTRQYRIHIPPQVSEPAALILVLHGYGGGNNDMMNNYGWTQLADQEGFVVAFPNGSKDFDNQRFWDVDYDFHQGLDIDDDGFLRELALYLQNEHQLDPDRTFVTGFSNGAEMCFQLACRESETFVATAPIIGMMLDTLFTNCNPTIVRPMLSMNGTADGVTWYGGDMSNAGGWGAYRSIPETMALWAEKMQSQSVNSTSLPDVNQSDGSTVRLDVYTSFLNTLTLKYYLVLGGGHDWPGNSGNMDINATNEVWNFFSEINAPVANPADLTNDGQVGGPDLALVLAYWGTDEEGIDINSDGTVDARDVAYILAAWTQ